VVENLADSVRARCVTCTYGSWIPAGAHESNTPTLRVVTQALARHERVVVFVDELNKFFGAQEPSSWHSSVLNDLWMLLDRRPVLNREHLADVRSAQSIEELADMFRRRVFIVAAGNLRIAVRRRYADELDFSKYEPRIRKLIDTHLQAGDVQPVTEQVSIFDKDAFAREVEKLQTPASKADTIAHRTLRTITEKWEEDPVFFKRFSDLIRQAIEDYRLKRIADAEYLRRVAAAQDAVPPERAAEIMRIVARLDHLKKDDDLIALIDAMAVCTWLSRDAPNQLAAEREILLQQLDQRIDRCEHLLHEANAGLRRKFESTEVELGEARHAYRRAVTDFRRHIDARAKLAEQQMSEVTAELRTARKRITEISSELSQHLESARNGLGARILFALGFFSIGVVCTGIFL
jgi:hypothetical protein